MDVENLDIYLVISDKYKRADEVSSEMQQVLDRVRCLKLNHKWITEDECVTFHSFKKTDIFVFEEFKGRGFEAIDLYGDCLIVGSRCLLICLTVNISIPITKYPIFSLAMTGCIVTSSSFSRKEKEHIKNLVHYMGGQYTNSMLETTTHLVASTVITSKCNKAYELKIPVMTIEWIDAVWEASQAENIKSIDAQFQHFRCPLFYNLVITSSRLSRTQRAEISDHIIKNGGKYTPDMATDETHVLIITEPSGEKYKHARKFNIPCVKPTWVYECVANGFAIPFDFHLLKDKPKCSTPLIRNNANTPNFYETQSHISAIHGGNDKAVVNHTPTTINTVFSYKASSAHFTTPKKGATLKSYRQIMEHLNISDAKNSGACLDGCKVFLSGFNASEEEKLKRILNYGGAVRFTDLNESVTHVIIGDYNKTKDKHLETFHNRHHIVTLDWLRDSLKQKCALPESNYNFTEQTICEDSSILEQPSPLSKKGLQMLTPKKIDTAVETSIECPLISADEELIRKYIEQPDDTKSSDQMDPILPADHRKPPEPILQNNPNNCLQNVSSNSQNFQEISTEQVFSGLQFKVADHDIETTRKIIDKITACGGQVLPINYNSSVDYVIVPIADALMKTKFKGSEVVTFIWLNDCLCNKKLMPVMLYHRPTNIPQLDVLPLSDCVITFSVYMPAEKMFIEHIAVALGAKCQDVLSKKVNEKAKALKTTHLVCPSAEGEKYKAAKKWNLPIVTKDWLFECLKHQKKLPEDSFAVSVGTNNCDISTDDPTIKLVNATTKIFPGEDKLSQCKFKKTENINGVYQNQTVTPNRLPSDAAAAPIPPRKLISSRSNSQNKFKNMAANSPQFPRLDNLSTSGDNLNLEVDNDIGLNNSLSYLKTNRIVVTATSVTTPTTSIITTSSTNSKSTITVAACGSNISHFISPTTAAAMAYKSSSTKQEPDMMQVQDSKQSTPDGLLQQVKQMSQLLSNPSLGGQKPNLKVREKYPFADPSRCEKRKFNDEEKHQPEVWWDDPFGDTNHKRTKSEDEVCEPAETTDYDTLLAQCDIPDENRNKSNVIVDNEPVVNNPKNFVLSNFSDLLEKKNIEETIRKLGGNVLTGNHYEQECTHLITNRLIKSEKILCCIAAGKWVLHPSYVIESEKSITFLQEDNYEWGDTRIKNKFIQKNEVAVKLLAEAAVRWRKQITCNSNTSNTTAYCKKMVPDQNEKKGAFAGMKAVFFTDAGHTAAFTRVIEAGTGEVLQSSMVLEATHFFIGTEDKYMKNIPVPLQSLAEHGVHVLPTSYLNDYLTLDPIPDPKTCYIDAYKIIISKIQRK